MYCNFIVIDGVIKNQVIFWFMSSSSVHCPINVCFSLQPYAEGIIFQRVFWTNQLTEWSLTFRDFLSGAAPLVVVAIAQLQLILTDSNEISSL
jgi:hypothetical protein